MQHDDGVNLNEIIGDPGWFPMSFDAAQQRFSFIRTNRATLASEPFLDYRWDRAGHHHVQVPFEAVAARLAPADPQARMHFLWHTSFCCSTVIAAALDHRGANLSLREPAVLVMAADAKRETLNGRRPMPPRLPEVAFRLLARRHADGECITVKPSNFANILIQDAARWTAGKSLFLYSDLERFLLTVANGGLPLKKYARRLFAGIVGDRGERPPWSIAEIIQLSDLEVAAIAWHLQIAEFQRSRAFLADRVASLNCDRFLADPLSTLAKLDQFFELQIGAPTLQHACGSMLTRNAKRPGHPFDADRKRSELDATRASLGSELQDIVEWSYRACPGTPRGDPLPDPL